MGRSALVSAIAATLLAAIPAPPAAAGFGPFGSPRQASIAGYPGSVEEPFITPDGRYLLFNSSEEEPDFTLQYAAALPGGQAFEYLGAIAETSALRPIP